MTVVMRRSMLVDEVCDDELIEEILDDKDEWLESSDVGRQLRDQ